MEKFINVHGMKVINRLSQGSLMDIMQERNRLSIKEPGADKLWCLIRKLKREKEYCSSFFETSEAALRVLTNLTTNATVELEYALFKPIPTIPWGTPLNHLIIHCCGRTKRRSMSSIANTTNVVIKYESRGYGKTKQLLHELVNQAIQLSDLAIKSNIKSHSNKWNVSATTKMGDVLEHLRHIKRLLGDRPK